MRPLLPGPLDLELVQSMSQIELSNNLVSIIIISYLKPFSCVPIICI